jgi:4-amino-4-deoxy-L-arabinose transferase-like glycosyltransferase
MSCWFRLSCASVLALYRLANFWLPRNWSALAAGVFAINPGLLYMQTTAMTEPLFLALFLWALVWTGDCILAMDANAPKLAAAALFKTAIVLAAAILSRYDGWVLTAFLGLLLLLARGRQILTGPRRLRLAVAFFTVLVMAAPLWWLWYNARYFHDPLDFLRGPYSAKAIEARTTPPGSLPHPGYHAPWIATKYYLRASTLGAASQGAMEWLLLLSALAGTAAILRRRPALRGVALLVWFPLPFYVYSITYGSVPVFVPMWGPNSYYNTRYGMELLPALSLYPVAALYGFARWRQRQTFWLRTGWVVAVANACVLAVTTPLVLHEAIVNSATRIPFERDLAAVLATIPPQDSVLMYTSAYAGALQTAGMPLRQTINESNYYLWKPALEAPAARADYVVAVDGDPVARAVAAHPVDLLPVATITSQGQPGAIIYRSIYTRAP